MEFQVLFDKVAGLETAEDVRALLQDSGITGRVGSASGCPLSTWFRVNGHRVSTVPQSIGPGYIRPWPKDLTDYEVGDEFPLSPAMNQFAHNFDRDMYPELNNGEEN